MAAPRATRWGWGVIALILALAAAHAWFTDRHVQLVTSLGRADVKVSTPYRQIRPDFTVDGHMWIRYAVALWRGQEGPQLRHTDIDNAPVGREVHWHSGLAWWLAVGGRVWQAVAGGTLEHGVERWAMWENLPLLALFMVLFARWTARRGGWLAGALVGAALVVHRGVYEGFWPGYADHHGLIAVGILGMALGAFWMRGGWIEADPQLAAGAAARGRKRADDAEESAVKAAISAARWSGFWGGFGMWISTASLAPVLALMPVAAGVATWVARRREGGRWRFEPRVWQAWGRAGALTSLAFYALEYFPHHLGWRLEVNHPLYALAWWAGAELTARLLPWISGRRVAAGAVGRTALWTVPLILAPVVAIKLGGAHVFLLSDPFLVGLHRTITEFLPLFTRVRIDGVGTHYETLLLYPIFYVFVGVLIWRGRPEGRFALTFTLVPTVLLHALGLWQTRWGMSAAPLQVVLLVTGINELRASAWASVARWRRPAIVVAAVLAFFTWPTVVRAVDTAKVAYYRAVLPGDARQVIYREVAEMIRESQPQGDVVLFASPNTSVNVAFFGDFKTLGTLYWENVDGLKAAAEISSARTEEEAVRLIRKYGVTHLAFFKDSNYIAEYAQLLDAKATEAELKATFGYRVLGERVVPLWLEPLPYAAPKGLPKEVDPEVLVFRVNFAQTVAQGTYRLGALQAKRGETNDALASFARAAELEPKDPAPRLRMGELLVGEKKFAEAREQFDAAIALAPQSEHYRLLTQGALAFEGAGQPELAIEFYERALRAGPTNVIAGNNLAWLLAVSAPDELRNPQRALELAERCVSLQPEVPAVLDTLAAAQAANGLFTDAVATAEKALRLVKSSDEELRARLHDNLANYRAGRTADPGK